MSQCGFVADGLAKATNVGTAKHLHKPRGIVALQTAFKKRKMKELFSWQVMKLFSAT